MKSLPLALYLLLVLLCLAAPAQAQEHGEKSIEGSIRVERGDDLKALAKITPDQAKAAARSRVSRGTAEEAELENEEGYLIYAVEFDDGGEETEVLVDAGDGSVLAVESDKEDDDSDRDDEVYEDEDAERGEAYEQDEENEEEEREDEERGHLKSDLPEAVEQAFHRTYPNAQLVGTDVEHEKGATFYEIESRDGAARRDLLYRADGSVYETEETVSVSALPQALHRAARQHGEIVKAERVTEGSTTRYELLVESKGERREILMDASGRVLETSSKD